MNDTDRINWLEFFMPNLWKEVRDKLPCHVAQAVPIDLRKAIDAAAAFPTRNGMDEPLVVAVALALYAYNVSAVERARKLHDHFNGNCMEFEDLFRVLRDQVILMNSAYAATEFPQEIAEVYVRHAMEKYGMEARDRITANRCGC